MPIVYIFIGIIIILTIYLIATYNGFMVLSTRIKEAFSGIDVQLKRRTDLIPNLVETVKGYAKHEKNVFEDVTKARSALLSAQALQDKANANNQLSQALKSLFALAEAYPQLQASQNFQELQRQLEDTEDKIAYARQFYNSNVLDYNAKLKTFPSNIIGQSFGFKESEFFTANEEERKKIEVKF